MSNATINLHGANILILEDDYYLATDLQDVLEAAGGTVLGPFPDEVEAGRSVASGDPNARPNARCSTSTSDTAPRSTCRANGCGATSHSRSSPVTTPA